MIPLKLQEIVGIIGAQRRPVRDFTVTSVSIDSRTLERGDLFFAVRGDRFDGHDFVTEALDRGACAAVVEAGKPIRTKNPVSPYGLRVNDAIGALGRLAHHCRTLSPAVFIAVTGSNGKTTVKDMTHHILAETMDAVKSPKSYNNFIGVPLSLLGVTPQTRAAVVELGTNAPGEIAYLSEMVLPHIGVITNIGLTHLAGLKDINGVAEEKSQLLRSLSGDGLAVLNADDRWFESLAETAPCPHISYGLEGEAAFTADEICQNGDTTTFYLNGLERITLGCPGRHNVSNALAAIAVAQRMGVGVESIRRALETFSLPPMRLEREEVAAVTLINDAYNANPHSVGAAISVLDGAPCAGKKILVIGEMAELGAQSREIHRSIGKAALASGLDRLIAVGGDARYIYEAARAGGKKLHAQYCENIDKALDVLLEAAREGDIVLFKASREAQLERLIAAIRDRLASRVADALCPTV
ncbi:MAG: UDP-N-acetylmuramoyl-tripeptide--D-alanyl-D-alanine ligase [Planctomycetota bacterium]